MQSNSSKQKKIAILSTIQPETHYTRYLYQALKQLSNDIYILVDLTPENIRYAKKNNNKNIVPLWQPNLSLPFTILNYARKNNITTMHLQHEFNMYGGVRGVPIFIITLILLRLARIHTVITIHAVVDSRDIDRAYLSTFALDRFAFALPVVKLFFYCFYILTGILSSKTIVHSKFTQQVCLDRYYFKKKKSHVLPIGIAQYEGKAKSPSAIWYKKIKGQRYILYFGYLLRRKGLEILLESFAKLATHHKNLKLVLAGGTLPAQKNYINNLKRLAKKLNLANSVIFTGFISEKEITFLYQNSDYVVLPYTHSISSSLPLSLAFQNKRPIIASNIGTLKDELKPNKNGLLFQSGSSQDLYKQMKKLSGSKTLLNKLSRGAAKEASDRTWDNIALDTYNLYK